MALLILYVIIDKLTWRDVGNGRQVKRWLWRQQWLWERRPWRYHAERDSTK